MTVPEKAIDCAQETIRQKGNFIEANIYLASALGYLSRGAEALQALGPFEKEAWAWVENFPYFSQPTKNHILEGLRKTGLKKN